MTRQGATLSSTGAMPAATSQPQPPAAAAMPSPPTAAAASSSLGLANHRPDGAAQQAAAGVSLVAIRMMNVFLAWIVIQDRPSTGPMRSARRRRISAGHVLAM